MATNESTGVFIVLSQICHHIFMNLMRLAYQPLKLWSYIVKSEDGFTIEQIQSEFSENIEKELLNVFLRNCVETGQLKLEDETYSVSLENKKFIINFI